MSYNFICNNLKICDFSFKLIPVVITVSSCSWVTHPIKLQKEKLLKIYILCNINKLINSLIFDLFFLLSSIHLAMFGKTFLVPTNVKIKMITVSWLADCTVINISVIFYKFSQNKLLIWMLRFISNAIYSHFLGPTIVTFINNCALFLWCFMFNCNSIEWGYYMYF